MASGTLATLRILLGLDATEVEKGVDKAKAATSGFGSAAKVGFAIAGTAAAVGFGLMSKGAVEMEAAQGDFQAATGASREEAVAFSKDMNSLAGSAGTVGKSFQDIYKTGITVANSFGVQGDKAKKLTSDIFDFAKVTHQDAEPAAAQLEDTLTAFGLSADDATGFMDKLVVSHQKYGTDVGPETLAIMQQIAPAIEQLGGNADDAVGFLNAMESAGLDSGTAVKGLTAAVKNVPDGTSLNDIIAKFGEMKAQGIDPTNEAIKVFGAKAGIGLAKIIQPGMTSLDDFKISAQDAAGATTKASEDMLTSGDRIRQFADKAGAALRGLGQDFGPLVTGIASLGSLAAPFASKLKDLFAIVAKSGPLKVAAGLVGTVTGTAQAIAHEIAATGSAAISSLSSKISAMGAKLAPAGTAAGTVVGAAMAAGAAVGVVGIGVLITNAIMDQAKQHGDEWHDAIFGAGSSTLADAKTLGKTVAQYMAQGMSESDAVEATRKSWSNWSFQDFDKVYADALQLGTLAGTSAGNAFSTSIITQSERTENDKAYADLGLNIGTTVSDSAVAGFEQAKGYQAMGQWWHDHAMDEFKSRGKEAGEGISTSMADAMNDSKSTGALFDSIDQLKDAIEGYLDPREQALKLIGGKYITTLGKGMESEDEGIRTTAQDLAIGAIATIEKAGLTGEKGQKGLKQVGILYDQLLASGMTAQQAAAELTAAGVGSDVITALTGQKQQNAANAGGVAVANAWVTGVQSKLLQPSTWAKIDRAAAAATSGIHGLSPPKRGPLHYIDKWGENIGLAWVGGLAGGVGNDSLLNRALQKARDRFGAWSSPLNGMSFQPAFAGAGAGGSGDSYTVNAYAWRPDDITESLDRARRRALIRSRLSARIPEFE